MTGIQLDYSVAVASFLLLQFVHTLPVLNVGKETVYGLTVLHGIVNYRMRLGLYVAPPLR